MRYELKGSFLKSIKRFPPEKKDKITNAIRQLVSGLETKQTPGGLGLKPLRKNIWEIRAGIKDRIVFRLTNDLVEFVIAGDHDDVKNFIKHV